MTLFFQRSALTLSFGLLTTFGHAASWETGELFRIINEERAREGLGGFWGDDTLMRVAQGHADDMVERNYFSHTSPEFWGMAERYRGAGVFFHIGAENIAWGQQTPWETFQAWMNSPGHRDNLMNPAFHKMGIGMNSWKWVANFTD